MAGCCPPPPGRAQPADIAWIGAVGDVMPGTRSGCCPSLRRRSYAGLRDTLPILQSCTSSSGTSRQRQRPTARRSKSYTFRFSGKALAPLARAGFRYFSLANNHSFDFGLQGFLDTISALREAGIGTSGVGIDEMAAALPFHARAGSQDMLVLSFSATLSTAGGSTGENRRAP